MSPSQLFEQVVHVAPSFDTVLREHIDKEMLPHLLITDLLRFLQSAFSGTLCDGAAPPTTAEIEDVFRVLDRGLSEGDDHTENAIAVSFVEGIELEPHFGQLKPFLGPIMQKEMARQRQCREHD